MSYPTILSPWYVVQKIRPTIQYYRNATVEDMQSVHVWADSEKDAMVFTSLQSAARVAKATAGEVRVLTSREDLEEFRPGGI